MSSWLYDNNDVQEFVGGWQSLQVSGTASVDVYISFNCVSDGIGDIFNGWYGINEKLFTRSFSIDNIGNIEDIWSNALYALQSDSLACFSSHFDGLYIGIIADARYTEGTDLSFTTSSFETVMHNDQDTNAELGGSLTLMRNASSELDHNNIITYFYVEMPGDSTYQDALDALCSGHEYLASFLDC